jgi:hypothetical protein
MDDNNLPKFIDPNKYPDFWEQMKGFAEFTGKQVKQVSNNPGSLFVEQEIQEKRMSICNTCDFFNKSQNRCRKCGCYMSMKVKFKDVKCPISLW